MLRNRRGATSLRWLRALLDDGIEVHGQVVVCPGVNDGAVLDDTLRRRARPSTPSWRRSCVVPLGVSRYQHRAGDAAAHRRPRRAAVVDAVERLAGRVPRRRSAAGSCSPPTSTTCSPAGRSRDAERLRGLPDARGRHRHGAHVRGRVRAALRRRRRPARAAGLLRRGSTARPPRATARRATAATPAHDADAGARSRRDATRPIGDPHRRATARAVLAPLVAELGRADVRVVAGRQRVLRRQHRRHRPAGRRRPRAACSPPSPTATATCCPTSACREGRFLDGTTVADLPRPVEVVATDGIVAARARSRGSR